MKQQVNIPLIVLGSIMIISSGVNYLLSNDFNVLECFKDSVFVDILEKKLKVFENQINMIESIKFQDLNNKNLLQVLSWRNDSRINHWMNNNTVQEEEHFNFVSSLDNDNAKDYRIVRMDNKNIGVISLINIIKGSTAELGIYKNPFLNKSGVGSILMNEIIKLAVDEYDIKKIFLQVKSINQVAIALYQKFKFKIVHEVNGYINMEKNLSE